MTSQFDGQIIPSKDFKRRLDDVIGLYVVKRNELQLKPGCKAIKNLWLVFVFASMRRIQANLMKQK